VRLMCEDGGRDWWSGVERPVCAFGLVYIHECWESEREAVEVILITAVEAM
jgi:hypothetical protein